MAVRSMNYYRLQCDEEGCTQRLNLAAFDTTHLVETLDELKNRDGTKWVAILRPDHTMPSFCPAHMGSMPDYPAIVERIPDLTREQYLALTQQEKEARLVQQQAYADQFKSEDYPVRDQRTPELQCYADFERATGYNPPGVYC